MYMMHHTGDARCDKSALLEAPTHTPHKKHPAHPHCQSRMLLNACTALQDQVPEQVAKHVAQVTVVVKLLLLASP